MLEKAEHCLSTGSAETKPMAKLERSYSSSSSQTSIKDLRSRALVPLLLVAAAQTSSILYQKIHLRLGLAYESLLSQFPSTVDTQAVLLFLSFSVLACVLYVYFLTPGPTLLVDFACLNADESQKVTKSSYAAKAKLTGFYTERSLDFMNKILSISGIGDETYGPPSVLSEPPDRTLTTCYLEAQMQIFGVLDELFAKRLDVKPKDIGVLVVNCSVYCPVPSLSAMIVNYYKMRGDIEAYNLGGMGCSAGIISLDLAGKVLAVKRNMFALVVSVEVVSGYYGYKGNDRSMMLGNCLFRWGSAAILLSNRRANRWNAKYEIHHIVKTHKGADDMCYNSVRQVEDREGVIGIALSKNLMLAAGGALETNITSVAPHILPLSEKIKFALNFIARKLLGMELEPYIPDFTKAVQHFVVHPGGKTILDGIATNLKLNEWHMEPSRMTLHRFGNVSSSSLWYVLAYMEAKGRVKRGDKVWQIALGSGMKVNSAILKSLRRSDPKSSGNVWSKFIGEYPQQVVCKPLENLARKCE